MFYAWQEVSGLASQNLFFFLKTQFRHLPYHRLRRAARVVTVTLYSLE